jgi:lipopolysaccharide export system protein LptA
LISLSDYMLSNLYKFSRRSVQQVSGLALPLILALPIVVPLALTPRIAEAAPAQTLQLRANTTEANSITGVVVARGNVLITYPARSIEATATQAIYFSKENKIVLSGNVVVLQDGGGNSLKGETITYLVKEGRFIATPQEGRQVEATYTIQDIPAAAPAPAAIPTNPAPVKPAKMPFPTAPKPEGAVLPGPNPEKQDPK